MIVKLDINSINDCAKLAHMLWPNSKVDELVNDFSEILGTNNDQCFLFVDEMTQDYIGFVHISLRRDYVEGCSSSPVAYIEGIYVMEGHRRRRIAQKLIEAGEVWAKEKGCSEIASDCTLENKMSIDFHKGIGFEEANKIVCFIKSID